MNYTDFLKYYNTNNFRAIDKEQNAYKFYLLRTISKKASFKKFIETMNLSATTTLDDILNEDKITTDDIIKFIDQQFKIKTGEEIDSIVCELNKMQHFDWGGSFGNSLEKNIVNNYIKKFYKYTDITTALSGDIQLSVNGYTLNSWYNHWSSILIEELFNKNQFVIPTLDLVKGIDFFINKTPYDLKVTYFPEELMKEELKTILKQKFSVMSELSAMKKTCKNANIIIPSDLKDKALSICLYTLLNESLHDEAQQYIKFITAQKKKVIEKYIAQPERIMKWLYENQGEMRFDASNRLFLILVDSSNIYDSWKLKRNIHILDEKISSKIQEMSSSEPKQLEFLWKTTGQSYIVKSDVLFIIK